MERGLKTIEENWSERRNGTLGGQWVILFGTDMIIPYMDLQQLWLSVQDKSSHNSIKEKLMKYYTPNEELLAVDSYCYNKTHPSLGV